MTVPRAIVDRAEVERRHLTDEEAATLTRLRRIQREAGTAALAILGARVRGPNASNPDSIHWVCFRCDHAWAAHGFRYPRMCPRCKSAYWDLERDTTTAHVVREALPPDFAPAPMPRTSPIGVTLPPPPSIASSISTWTPPPAEPPQPERAVSLSLSRQLADRLERDLQLVTSSPSAVSIAPSAEPSGEPSAEDLDAVAEEAAVVEQTAVNESEEPTDADADSH